jgi:CHAD domain-containing protein
MPALLAEMLKARGADVLKAAEHVEHRVDKDPDAVHDLRVASRRLKALLDGLGHRAEADRIDDLSKALKKLRKKCGDARDCEVRCEFLGSLLEKANLKEKPGLEALLSECVRQRRRAHRKLLQKLPEAREQIAERLKRLTRTVSEPSDDRPLHSESLGAVALAHLPAAADRFWTEIANRGDGPDSWHRMRLACKRLRYTLELYTDGLPNPIGAKLLPALQQAQKILGDVQDARAGLEFVTDAVEACEKETEKSGASPQSLRRKWQPGIAAVRQAYIEQRTAAHRDFDRLWPDLERGEINAILRRSLVQVASEVFRPANGAVHRNGTGGTRSGRSGAKGKARPRSR